MKGCNVALSLTRLRETRVFYGVGGVAAGTQQNI
jgi:hypothetical protein